jgi:(-)-germacrene D synthase
MHWLVDHADMFNKFKDSDGKLKESLRDDVIGLQSLYEATHLRVQGEDLLGEALTFTTTHLESAANHLSLPLSKQVRHALNQPLWKGLPRLEARHYLSLHQELHGSRNQTLLSFAKLDFNLVQQVHQKELSDIARLTIKEICDNCYNELAVFVIINYVIHHQVVEKLGLC